MRELNRFLRKLFIICGGLFLLIGLIPETRRTENNREGFDNEEFDDIW